MRGHLVGSSAGANALIAHWRSALFFGLFATGLAHAERPSCFARDGVAKTEQRGWK
jgi:hypothetical protein